MDSFNIGLLVIDGDWLAYVIAASLETTSIKIFDTTNTFVKEYSTRTKYKADIKNYNESYKIEDCQTLKPNHNVLAEAILKNMVNKYLRLTQCNEVLIALGGETNFRDRLPLPRKYKGSRDGEIRPKALKQIRTLLPKRYNTVYSKDEEADDIISKYQYLSFSNIQDNNGDVFKNRIVVLTLDKDARSTPGLLFDPKKNNIINIEGLGYLERKKKTNGTAKLYGIGRKWFYTQLLTGDKADDYFPCDIYKTITNNESKSPIYTDLKAFKLLDPCVTDKDCLEVIKNTYYNWYKDVTEWQDFNGNTIKGDWLDILQMYVDVVHMRRFDNDRIIIKDVLNSFELVT